jgi:electron transfer flavoprotein alpha subunit
MSAATLVLVEHKGGSIFDSSLRALSAALELGAPVDLLLVGSHVQDAAQKASQVPGVRAVKTAEASVFGALLAEPVAALLASLKGEYTAFVAAATAVGKNTMPRLAALLDVMLLSDITKVLGNDTFERPIYAGNAIQTVQSLDTLRVITVRTAAFSPAPVSGGQAGVSAVSLPDVQAPATFVKFEGAVSERPELSGARVVVSGGRALGSEAQFKAVLEPLADKLGAALGASRAAVDAGYAPNDWQVGQTGKVVAPELYIAVGISGAIQHMAGMKDSKVIVAINKDPDAPIFQVADYGLVGDLFTLVPELVALLPEQAA